MTPIFIKLEPFSSPEPLTLSRSGETLIFNGTPLDLSEIGEAPVESVELGSPWLIGDVVREDETLIVSIRLPYGEYAPQETLFPDPITSVQNGTIALPPFGATPPVI